MNNLEIVPFGSHNKYISGTTVAAILGVNPYLTPYEVWDKIYNSRENVKGSDFSEKKKRAGLKLEKAIIEMFEEDTGNKVIYTPEEYGDVTFVSKEYPFLAGTRDGYYLHDDGRKIIVECKNLGYRTAKQFSKDESPYFYYLQGQWYCWLFGADGVQFVYLIDGFDFQYTDIFDRDNAVISMMLDTAIKFWDEHIMTGIPPTPTTESEVLQMYPDAVAGKRMPADDDMLTAVTFYRELCAQAKEIEKNKEEVKDSIIAFIKDAEVLDRNGETLATYKTIKQNRINGKALESEMPDIYTKFLKEISFRKLDVK